MIAVLCWYDGFGNDTCVFGIYENLETAKEHCIDIPCYDGRELRYQTFLLNSPVDFDYYEAKPLFNKKNRWQITKPVI